MGDRFSVGPLDYRSGENSPNESCESCNICAVHLSQVDLNLFVVLEAIYREGNLTRAGRQLKLTQPAMSHALKRLRELLQDPLFIREGANMVPTPFSRNMINEVRQALQILEVSLFEDRNFEPAHTRRDFQIGFWEL